MSDHAAIGIASTPQQAEFEAALASEIRTPESMSNWDAATDSVTYTFTPDLTAEEAQTFADLVRLFRTRLPRITLAEYQALKPALVEVRAFRTRTPAQWNALTAANREADEIAWLRHLTDVLRALIRD